MVCIARARCTFTYNTCIIWNILCLHESLRSLSSVCWHKTNVTLTLLAELKIDTRRFYNLSPGKKEMCSLAMHTMSCTLRCNFGARCFLHFNLMIATMYIEQVMQMKRIWNTIHSLPQRKGWYSFHFTTNVNRQADVSLTTDCFLSIRNTLSIRLISFRPYYGH